MSSSTLVSESARTVEEELRISESLEWSEICDIHTAWVPGIGELKVYWKGLGYRASVFGIEQDEVFFQSDVAKSYAVNLAKRTVKEAYDALSKISGDA